MGIRKQKYFRGYSEKEIQTLHRLRELAEQDKDGSDQVLMIRDSFTHITPTGQDHLCIAFEHLNTNLRAVGKLEIDRVCTFAKQLVFALRFLHDVVGLVHCDVKPDNLMLRHDEKAVK